MLTCRLTDVGPHTWSALHSGHKLGGLPLPFYGQPIDAASVGVGEQAPLQLRCARQPERIMCATLLISCTETQADRYG